MKTLTVKKVMALSIMMSLALSLMSCGKKPEEAGNLNIQLAFGSYTTAQNESPFWKLFGATKANASVTSLKMCFKRLRFKLADQDTANPAADSDNVDFALGEVTIDGTGGTLGSISIPEGVYKRIEFDLEPDCASGKSIQLTNGNGTYTSTDRITIKFSGQFVAEDDGVLTLGVQTILNALNSYNGAGTLKTTAEAVSGSLSN